MDEFSRLPLGQAKLLLRLAESRDHTAFAEGKSEGASAKELLRKRYVRTFGMLNRRIRWKLLRPISPEGILMLKTLVK